MGWCRASRRPRWRSCSCNVSCASGSPAELRERACGELNRLRKAARLSPLLDRDACVRFAPEVAVPRLRAAGRDARRAAGSRVAQLHATACSVQPAPTTLLREPQTRREHWASVTLRSLTV